MKVIVGLGNPGRKYSDTRHNIGFRVLEEIARRSSIEKEESRFDAIIGHIRIGGEKVFLVKPLTYMNLCGRAVGEAAEYLSVAWEDVLIVYDDVALPFGKLRMRAKGSAGGHKGLVSVLTRAGTLEVPRLRIGVGAAPAGRGMVSWVLGAFSGEERAELPSLLDRTVDAIANWLDLGTERAMNRVNTSS